MEALQEIPFVDIHTHRAGSPYPSLYSVRLGKDKGLPARPFSAGVHPWDVDTTPANALNAIEPDGLNNRFLCAIGETGLDFAATSDREKQYEWFRRQLSLTSELELPLIIHCVKAYNETLSELENFDGHVIFHGFTGSPELARQILEKGHYLSFGATMFRSPKTAEALRITPASKLFLETDESELNIDEIYVKASGIRGRTVNELKNDIYNNFNDLFPSLNG